MKDVSIIIVNYHTEDLIKNLLDSVYAQTEGISFEIIVVDNAPGKKLPASWSIYADKITYLPLVENVGFGRANNAGLELATGRNVFFLNPDTLLKGNPIKCLSDYLDAHPKVGVCGGNLYDEAGCPTHSYMPLLPSPLWELNDLLGGLIFKLRWGKNFQFNYTQQPMKVGYITGADMMVRKSVLDEIGGFDPDFFMYYEETELTYRIAQKGYASHNVPQAEVIHLEGKSIATSDKREQLKSVSRKLYYQKTSNACAYWWANTLQRINCWCRIAAFAMSGKSEQKVYWKTILRNI